MEKKVAYEDESCSITAGIDLRTLGLDIDQQHQFRNLENGVKFTSKIANEAKFIQFATRIVPNLYEIRHPKVPGINRMEWDRVSQFYMGDSENPQWKLDVTQDANTCFYEDYGLSKIENDNLSIFDCPGGSTFEEERAVFCTFLVIKGNIVRTIKWSKECVYVGEIKEENIFEGYSFLVDKTEKEKLPDWALFKIFEFYYAKKIKMPAIFGDKEKLNELFSKKEEEIGEEAKKYFLPPPKMWKTKVLYPELFLK